MKFEDMPKRRYFIYEGNCRGYVVGKSKDRIFIDWFGNDPIGHTVRRETYSKETWDNANWRIKLENGIERAVKCLERRC